MRPDLLHCVTAAAHANARLAGHTGVDLPRHPAFRSLAQLSYELEDGATVDWNSWVEERLRPAQARCALIPEKALRRDEIAGDLGEASTLTAIHAAESWWLHLPAELRAARLGPADSAWAVLPLDDRTEQLREAVENALDGAETNPMWTADLRRALGILGSPATGEEVSDVAWPHFLLPEPYPLLARRLAAAAANCWIFGGGIAADLAAENLPPPLIAERLRTVVLGALATAVLSL